MGFLALVGVDAVRFEGQVLLGWQGFVASIVGSAFIAGLVTFFAASFGYVGLWLYSRFRSIELEYFPESSRNENS